MDQTWDNFKTHFTEVYFELKEDNELNKMHVVFSAKKIDQPHVKEANMDDALKNLANGITSYATNLTNLKTANAKLSVQLKVELSQNKVLTELINKKICNVTATQSENQNTNKQKRTENTRGSENNKSIE